MFSRVCDVLGIEYPIIQGGMAWVSTASLAAAVSENGGLGVIASGGREAEWLRKEIRRAREMTTKPIGVNIMLLSSNVDEVVKVALEEKIDVAIFGAGNPAKYVPAFKEIGAKVISVVASEVFAKRMESMGVDIVVAEGTEAGGHIGSVSTMVLVPAVVEAVSIPVVAAGGIATGKQIAASLMMGAEGVQIGTRFIATDECEVHQNYKEKILKASTRDAVITGRITGHPVRVLRNPLARELIKIDERCGTQEDIDKIAAGSLRAAAIEGDLKRGSFMAGQSAAFVKEIVPVKKLMKELWDETVETIRKFENVDMEVKE
nr:nitronate monooxygenase [Mesoaciditoga lauensis]